jgi:hypothetical protein
MAATHVTIKKLHAKLFSSARMGSEFFMGAKKMPIGTFFE